LQVKPRKLNIHSRPDGARTHNPSVQEVKGQ
jgi:hypothetical protein